MISRLGIDGIKLIQRFSANSSKVTNAVTKNVSNIGDSIKLLSTRCKNLNLFNSSGTRNHLFNFTNNGEIIVSLKISGSKDLSFLSHIKNKSYIKPKIYPQGTLPCTKDGIEQSNRLAKEIISEKDRLIDGYRYCGPRAQFDNSGKNISRFSNGHQEIVVVDRNLDKTLCQSIDAFKNRLNAKKLTDEEKINELMKYVDEVFSVSKSGAETSKLVTNMHSPEQLEVLLGDILNSGAGVCRHRSLFTKVLADEIGLSTRMIQGYYGGGGHAWNEIVTKGNTYLFDAMHGNIFNITNQSRNLVPQAFNYRVSNPANINSTVQKYFDKDSTTGLIYRTIGNKLPLKTSEAHLVPCKDGYIIEPLSDKVMVNGKRILEKTELGIGDFVNMKDIGFQII